MQWQSTTVGLVPERFSINLNNRVMFFIRPFEKWDVLCRGNVRPSVRPSFPDFSSTCFEISIWNMVHTFSRWHDMSNNLDNWKKNACIVLILIWFVNNFISHIVLLWMYLDWIKSRTLLWLLVDIHVHSSLICGSSYIEIYFKYVNLYLVQSYEIYVGWCHIMLFLLFSWSPWDKLSKVHLLIASCYIRIHRQLWSGTGRVCHQIIQITTTLSSVKLYLICNYIIS